MYKTDVELLVSKKGLSALKAFIEERLKNWKESSPEEYFEANFLNEADSSEEYEEHVHLYWSQVRYSTWEKDVQFFEEGLLYLKDNNFSYRLGLLGEDMDDSDIRSFDGSDADDVPELFLKRSFESPMEDYYPEKWATNIIWDIGLEADEQYEQEIEAIGLPCEVRLPVGLARRLNADLADDDDVSDYLSDKFGYCVQSFHFENLPSNYRLKVAAYALYKARWLVDHGGETLVAATYADYCKCLLTGVIDADTSFSEYVKDFGYHGGGMCYASFSEFLDNEFKDKEYMKSLLGEELAAGIWKLAEGKNL